MTVRQALADARRALTEREVLEAGLEAEVLLREALGRSRAQLYAELDRTLTAREAGAFGRMICRRLADEPTAYIVGRREFYGRDFAVGPAVLVPRPESELLVEEAARLAAGFRTPVVADIGTGSGAIGISIALEVPAAKVIATDISADALRVARENCRRHGVPGRVLLLQGDMLGAVGGLFDIMVANLPYVREDDIPAGAEPRLALDGGADGLCQIRRLCSQAAGRLQGGGHLLVEVGAGLAAAVEDDLRAAFPGAGVQRLDDLAGIERVVALTL